MLSHKEGEVGKPRRRIVGRSAKLVYVSPHVGAHGETAGADGTRQRHEHSQVERHLEAACTRTLWGE